MKNLKLVFKLMMMAILISGVTACSKNGSKSANLKNSRGAGPTTRQVGQQTMAPGGPAGNVNQSCPNCGYISNSNPNYRNVLADFLMIDQSMISNISGAQGAQTGAFFRGTINGANGNSLQGTIEIVVWDDQANQLGPYVVAMALESSKSDLKNFADLRFRDEVGTLMMNGSFTQNGTFQGTISFQNEGGPMNQLGNFLTGDCNFIIAGCSY